MTFVAEVTVPIDAAAALSAADVKAIRRTSAANILTAANDPTPAQTRTAHDAAHATCGGGGGREAALRRLQDLPLLALAQQIAPEAQARTLPQPHQPAAGAHTCVDDYTRMRCICHIQQISSQSRMMNCV